MHTLMSYILDSQSKPLIMVLIFTLALIPLLFFSILGKMSKSAFRLKSFCFHLHISDYSITSPLLHLERWSSQQFIYFFFTHFKFMASVQGKIVLFTFYIYMYVFYTHIYLCVYIFVLFKPFKKYQLNIQNALNN